MEARVPRPEQRGHERRSRRRSGYARAGYFTVVDGIISPPWFFHPGRKALTEAGCQVAYAILRPELAVAIERGAARSTAGLADAAIIEQLWSDVDRLDDSLQTHVFDTTCEPPEQTTRRVRERLEAGALNV